MSLSIRIAVIVSSVLGLLALLASTAVGQALHNEPALRSAIAAQMAQGPQNEAASVVDLGSGHVMFSDRAGTALPTASLMKLFTTSTALMRLGSGARLTTRVFATGTRQGNTLNGNLYLRGGGDFTFGNASFSRRAYGGGGTVQSLGAAIRNSGLRRIRGSVYGDASLFSDGTGTPFDLVLCKQPLFQGPAAPTVPPVGLSACCHGARKRRSALTADWPTPLAPTPTATRPVRRASADQLPQGRWRAGGRRRRRTRHPDPGHPDRSDAVAADVAVGGADQPTFGQLRRRRAVARPRRAPGGSGIRRGRGDRGHRHDASLRSASADGDRVR